MQYAHTVNSLSDTSTQIEFECNMFINPAFNHELSNTGAHISGWMLEQVPQLPVCGCVGTMACYGATIAPRGAGAWFLLIPQMLERRHVAPLTVSLLSQPALCTWLINRIGICRDQYNPSQLRDCKVYLNVWRIALIMQCFGEIYIGIWGSKYLKIVVGVEA